MILMVAVLYTAVGSSPSQQAAALYTLKGAIDPGNQLSDWTSGAASACAFKGVSCNGNSEVTSL